MQKRLLFVTALCAFAASSAFAQPVISPDGVKSAASYIPSGMPNAGIAPGSFFFIGGTGLGPSAIVVNAALPYQTTLGGTTVTFNVGGTSTQAFMYYSLNTALAGIVPSNTPVGTGTVTVAYSGATVSAPVTIVKSAFGMFTYNSQGTGPAAAQDFTTNYTGNTLRKTMKPGDIAILYGTGLGAVNCTGSCNEANGGGTGVDLRGPDSLDFHLYVGGQEMSLTYAGRSSAVGEDQIIFTLPSTVLTGCFVPVITRNGNTVSNAGTISIDANGGTCSDPFGMSPAQISQAATGSLTVGSVLLTRLGVKLPLLGNITEDEAIGRFYNFDGGANALDSPEFNPDFLGISSFGSCAITYCTNTSTCVPTSKSYSLTSKPLDAGSLMISKGGTGTSATVTSNNGIYHGLLGSSPLAVGMFPVNNYLVPGSYTVTGTGGADVNGFTANVSVPNFLTWNPSPAFANDSAGNASINRNSPLTVTWTPTSNASDYTLVSVTSASNTATIPANQFNAATITCLQKSSAGTFTVPNWILQALPASSAVNLIPGFNLPGGAVLVGTYNVGNTFTSNLGLGIANSIVLYGQNVDVQ